MDDKPPGRRRLSLTKAQRETVAGAELLSLCQTITEDGSLSEEEIAALRQWLDDNRSAPLPAIPFLTETVEQILADQKVTKEEWRSLYSAVETVLPPEARRVAADETRGVEAQEREQAEAARNAKKARQLEERERNRPSGSWNFMVAGARFEGRPTVVRQYLGLGDRVFLIRDRQNEHSRHAVEVRLRNGMQIGYVPEDVAVDIAPLLDGAGQHEAYCTKILTGGRAPIPVVQAYTYRSDANVDDAVRGSDVPAKRASLAAALTRDSNAKSSRSGCLVFLVALISISTTVAIVTSTRPETPQMSTAPCPKALTHLLVTGMRSAHRACSRGESEQPQSLFPIRHNWDDAVDGRHA
jgi:hypothetical protein